MAEKGEETNESKITFPFGDTKYLSENVHVNTRPSSSETFSLWNDDLNT